MPSQPLSQPRLLGSQLYGILDLAYCPPDQFVSATRQMIAGGIDILQLRAKGAPLKDIEKWGAQVLPICRAFQVPFIINDYATLASALGADGVHLGQDDLSTDAARAIVGEEMLVGRSTHSLIQAATAAADPRINYIGFGPLFATATKPDYSPIGTQEIKTVHKSHPQLPIFCIGGIKKENLSEVIAAGAKRVVIVSGILQASNIEKYVRETKAILSAHLGES